MIRYLAALAALCLISAGVSAQEVAVAPPTEVIIPWGDYLAAIIRQAQPIIEWLFLGFVAWMLTKLPKGFDNFVKPAQVDQLATKALQYAFNTVPDALEGKTAKVDVASERIAVALQYALDHGLSIVDWAGGKLKFGEKLVARYGEVGPTKEPEKNTAAVLSDPQKATLANPSKIAAMAGPGTIDVPVAKPVAAKP